MGNSGELLNGFVAGSGDSSLDGLVKGSQLGF
jgi:hypothetical protein